MRNLFKEFVKLGKTHGLGGIVDSLPNPDKVMKRTGTSYKGYRELLYDAHLWSCIQSRKSGTLSSDFDIIGEKSSFIRSVFDRLDIKRTMEDILDSLLYGFQPIEIYWEYDEQGNIVPNKLSAKPQELFYIDKRGELKYRPPGKLKGRSLPKMKFIDVRHRAGHSKPYGEALLSKCYWPVKFKNGGIRFWVNFMERYGMPVLIGKYTRGSTRDESEQLASELANMTEDSVIVTPNDIEVEMEEPHRYSSVRLYSELIKLCNAEISKAILSQTLTTEINVGSKAAAETHYKIRRELIRSDMRLVEESINKLIEYLLILNFGSSGDTHIKFNTNTESLQSRLDRDLKLLRSGAVKFRKEYWIKEYGYSEEDLE